MEERKKGERMQVYFLYFNSLILEGWDLGSVTYSLISVIYFFIIDRFQFIPPLWLTFLSYGLIIGIPTLLFILTQYTPTFLQFNNNKKRDTLLV